MRRRDLQERHGGRFVVLALLLCGAGLTASSAVAGTPELSATVTPAELSYGQSLSVTGRVGAEGLGQGGVRLALQSNPYPYHGFVTIARLASAADGTFAFAGIKLDRNNRMRVLAEGPLLASTRTLPVTIDPDSALNAASLGAGAARLSLRLTHTTGIGSPSVEARWFVAAVGTRVFRLAALTPTRELSPGLTYASATIDPPSRRFVYRVCVNPRWELAMGAPASHGACPQRDYAVPNDVG